LENTSQRYLYSAQSNLDKKVLDPSLIFLSISLLSLKTIFIEENLDKKIKKIAG
jgi:hypothetical protein